MNYATACVLALVFATGAAGRHAPPQRAGKRVLPITVVLNGSRLNVNPAPVFHGQHLLVPVRPILSALGLTFEKTGRYVRTYAGAKTIELLIGSKIAQVDNVPVVLDAAPVEIKNVLFAPLRFFAQALQAQAIYSRQTNSVEIVSTLVGRSGTGIVNNVNGQVQVVGTITRLDVNSDPPSITVTQASSVRTVAISPAVAVVIQNVDSGTSNIGDLSDVHTGDYAHVYLDKRGVAKRLVDAFGSRNGVIAAIASGQMVLTDGHVIVPSAATTISLNGGNATLDTLRVGDDVMVRYNIDSSEPLQIQATRTARAGAFNQSAVQITRIDVAPAGPLREGQTLRVTLHGTPGGLAGYDIGPYVTNLPLTETEPGVYDGTYRIRRGENFAGAPILGRLNVHGVDAPQAVSQSTVSVSTQAPGIADVAPQDGAEVNDSRPAVYATFTSGSVNVNASCAAIEMNGHDVTSSAVRTARFIEYIPEVDYPAGPVHVTVRVCDAAGNAATKAWTFFIRR